MPTPREYKLGDDVYVLLTLPDDPQRYPVAGRVAWVTPHARPATARRAWASSSLTKNRASSSTRSRKSWHRPGLRTSPRRPFELYRSTADRAPVGVLFLYHHVCRFSLSPELS